MAVVYYCPLLACGTYCETEHPKPQMVHNTGWQGYSLTNPHTHPVSIQKNHVECQFKLRIIYSYFWKLLEVLVLTLFKINCNPLLETFS